MNSWQFEVVQVTIEPPRSLMCQYQVYCNVQLQAEFGLRKNY